MSSEAEQLDIEAEILDAAFYVAVIKSLMDKKIEDFKELYAKADDATKNHIARLLDIKKDDVRMKFAQEGIDYINESDVKR